MSRQRWLLLVAAVGAVLAFAIATVPARLVVSMLPADSLLMSGFHGTLWKGSAARAVLATAAGPLQLGEVRWTLQPLSLLTLSPRVVMRAGWGQQQLSMTVQQRQQLLQLSAVDAVFDARLVSQLAPVALRGRVEMQFSELELDREFPRRAVGRLVWRDAAWPGPNGVNALGTYVVTLETSQVEKTQDGTIGAVIDTLSGPVQAQGSGRLRGRSYALDVTVSAASGLETELAQALSLVAVPTENGYLLRLDGVLSAPE